MISACIFRPKTSIFLCKLTHPQLNHFNISHGSFIFSIFTSLITTCHPFASLSHYISRTIHQSGIFQLPNHLYHFILLSSLHLHLFKLSINDFSSSYLSSSLSAQNHHLLLRVSAAVRTGVLPSTIISTSCCHFC